MLFRSGAQQAVLATGEVDEAALVREAAARAGVAYVAAPVSGNPGVVRAGNAVFAISGPPEATDLAARLCGAIGRGSHRVGDGVEATVVKLATNALLGVTMQTLAEIVVMGESAGVARGALLDFVNDSAVGSAFTRYKTPALRDLDLTVTFTPEGQRKDLRLARAVAASGGVPTPVLGTTEQAYTDLIESGRGQGLDFAALVLATAAEAGIDLGPTAPTETLVQPD